ncbi:ATP-binding protein [Luteipulveratus halotolerans]|uniref:ATP-binding protein n=1 Tax=Luteipulveratus halotolerans TaxID=1631356 RepID=UPI0006805A0F|nr:ATP-binding protein [Luteipulveratus halotolerans]
MVEAPNPFSPSFGTSPPLLVGRDEQLTVFIEALEEGVGAPGRATLYTGQRGSGKTVLLNALEDIARRQGWHVLSVTARPGVAHQLARTLIPQEMRDHHPEQARTSHVTGFQGTAAGFGGGISRTGEDRFPVEPSLRHALTALAAAAAQREAGVLISLDEISSNAAGDLQELCQDVQHVGFREGLPVMFTAAGLEPSVQQLLADVPGVTFLRRAERAHLGPVGDADVTRALAEPIAHFDKSIEPEALDRMVTGTQGYPFMIQLVGREVWRAARGQETITARHADLGVDRANRRIGQLVHQPALMELSPTDKSFLAQMALDDGPSSIAVIAQRMGVNSNYASQYRLRLIQAEIIHEAGRGQVDFSLPQMREYLREHATHDALRPPGGSSPSSSHLTEPQDRTSRPSRQERRRPPGSTSSGPAGPRR